MRELDSNNRCQLKFSLPHPMATLLPGLVCIGASQDRATLDALCTDFDLKNYLEADPARWKGVKQGGVNDFDSKRTIDHMSQNYAILRKAIQDFNHQSPEPTQGQEENSGENGSGVNLESD